PFILNIVTPEHPCTRDIPFILNIKRGDKNLPFSLTTKPY
ncbi:MAG: hypothetical protein ACI9YO_003178, partial [Gammaproteobacteria bacterium]